ncbi:MAG: DUF302 domain-containing protein [Chloroflexi bacterium]|nr:DUF302 domain-containing protein [Chloroflexota bacterium]
MTESIAFQVHLDQSYEEALESVATALKTEGFGVLTRIDVRATFQEKLGEDFRPYTILGACNPPLAHRAIAHDAQAGLILPCNLTVEADSEGSSIVRIADPAVILQVGSMGEDPVLREIADEARVRLERVAKFLER